ncbi:MAG: HIT family protein [Patescibacteria group bacterium]
MSDCIFCKIIAGEIPCHKVYEDENVLAFLDAFPHAKGHTVVVPKKHVSSIFDFDPDDRTNFSAGLSAAARRVNEAIKPDGMNIGVNDRPSAGQVVPHVHWHIFPRFENDGGGSVHSIVKTKEKIDVSEVAKLFV